MTDAVNIRCDWPLAPTLIAVNAWPVIEKVPRRRPASRSHRRSPRAADRAASRRTGIIGQSWQTVRLQQRIGAKIDEVRTTFSASPSVPVSVSVDANHVCSVLMMLVRALESGAGFAIYVCTGSPQGGLPSAHTESRATHPLRRPSSEAHDGGGALLDGLSGARLSPPDTAQPPARPAAAQPRSPPRLTPPHPASPSSRAPRRSPSRRTTTRRPPPSPSPSASPAPASATRSSSSSTRPPTGGSSPEARGSRQPCALRAGPLCLGCCFQRLRSAPTHVHPPARPPAPRSAAGGGQLRTGEPGHAERREPGAEPRRDALDGAAGSRARAGQGGGRYLPTDIRAEAGWSF